MCCYLRRKKNEVILLLLQFFSYFFFLFSVIIEKTFAPCEQFPRSTRAHTHTRQNSFHFQFFLLHFLHRFFFFSLSLSFVGFPKSTRLDLLGGAQQECAFTIDRLVPRS
jgi:hypothetical protein